MVSKQKIQTIYVNFFFFFTTSDDLSRPTNVPQPTGWESLFYLMQMTSCFMQRLPNHMTFFHKYCLLEVDGTWNWSREKSKQTVNAFNFTDGETWEEEEEEEAAETETLSSAAFTPEKKTIKETKEVKTDDTIPSLQDSEDETAANQAALSLMRHKFSLTQKISHVWNYIRWFYIHI